ARGLQTERTGAGVEIEDPRAVDDALVVEPGEEGLADPFARRPGLPLRHGDRAPARRAGHDPRHVPDPTSPSTPVGTPRVTTATTRSTATTTMTATTATTAQSHHRGRRFTAPPSGARCGSPA